AGGAGWWARAWGRPRGQAPDGGAQPLLAAGDDVWVHEAGVARDDFPTFVDQACVSVLRLVPGQTFDTAVDLVQVHVDDCTVVLRGVDMNTQPVGLTYVRGSGGGGDETLGRNAVGEDAGAADTVACHHRHIRPELRGDQCRLV